MWVLAMNDNRVVKSHFIVTFIIFFYFRKLFGIEIL